MRLRRANSERAQRGIPLHLEYNKFSRLRNLKISFLPTQLQVSPKLEVHSNRTWKHQTHEVLLLEITFF